MNSYPPVKPVSEDYFLEVGKGNVPGVSFTALVARNATCESASFEDLWGGGELAVPELVMVYPVIAETWEIVSESANDTSAGTGARTVFIQSLDINLLPQVQVVTLNGTTPVALTGEHYRPNGIFILTAGSVETNDGIVVLRASGGGAARNVALAGIGRSHDTHFTVPSDKDAFLLTTQILFPKDGSGQFRNQFRASTPDSAWNTGSNINPYQNSISFPFASLPQLPGGSDLRLQVKVDSGLRDVTTIFETILVDKSL